MLLFLSRQQLLRLAIAALSQLVGEAKELRIAAAAGESSRTASVISLSSFQIDAFLQFCSSQEPALIKASLRIFSAIIDGIAKLKDDGTSFTCPIREKGRKEGGSFFFPPLYFFFLLLFLLLYSGCISLFPFYYINICNSAFFVYLRLR